MSRAAIDPAAVEARVRQRIAERGLPPEQVEAVFSKIRPKLEASGLLPPMAPLPTMPGTDNWLARQFGLSPVQITPAKLSELNAAASTMMPQGPGPGADPLAAKYAASGGAYTESGGVIPQYRRGPSGDIVPPPRQIQPMDYGPEILAASRSVTPAEISAMRELAVVEGGSLDGQPDELVAVLAAARKMGRENTMTSAGPEVMPPAPPPTSPVGRFMDATAAGRGVRDFAQGVGSGAIVQPGAAITSTIGAGFDLARMPDTGQNFADAATLMQRQAPQSDSLAFQGGQIVGNVLPAAAVPFTGGGAMPLVMTLMGTQGFGSGVQEYRAAKQAQGKPIDPEEQALVGLAFAAIELGTEKIGIDSVFKAVPAARGAIGRFAQSPTKAAAREVLDVLGPVVATNAGEEASAQLGQNAVAKGVYDPNRNLAEGVGAAALGGAFGGLVMGAPAAASSGLNAGFAARVQAGQSRTRTDAGGQGPTTPQSAPASPAPEPAISPTMPQDAAVPATDPEAVDPTDAAAVARVDGLLAILEDESRVGTPEYEAARAELDSIGADAVASPIPVGEPSADQAAQPERGAGMRRVDRPARPMPPTVSLNPSEIPNGSATVDQVRSIGGPFESAPPSGSARFADRLGPFPRASNATSPSDPTSARPASSPTGEARTATGTEPGAGTSPMRALPGVTPPVPSGQAAGTGGGVASGTSASPKSTREPWQMTPEQHAQHVATTNGFDPNNVVGFSEDGMAVVRPGTKDSRTVGNARGSLRDGIAANGRINAALLDGYNRTHGDRPISLPAHYERKGDFYEPSLPAKPDSSREPWQMTRGEWVGGGTVGRIKFGDVDQEFVESPQFDTPEEAKAWAASRGIANAQIQSSGKRGGPKLYKASGSTSFHRDAVEAARDAGKPVPPEVLAEYGLTPNPPAKPDSSSRPNDDVFRKMQERMAKPAPAPTTPSATNAPAAERIASTFERIAADAEARMEARAKKRGTRLYSTPLPNPRDVIDTAIWIAAKVARAGVKSYGAIRRIINESLKERPGTKRRAAQIARETMAILRESRSPDKSYDLDKFEAAVGARQQKQTTTAETRAAVKETDGKAKGAPTVTERQALKARYRAERKAANAADRAARGEEREKAKMDRRQRAERSRFELGQLRDTLKAAASNQKRASDLLNTMLQRTADDLERQLTKAQIADGLREQLVKTIQDTLPAAVRGKLLTDVRDVATLSGMARAMTKARKELARYEGRAAYVDVKRNTKKRVLLGLTEARRATIDGLIQTVGAARQQLLDAKTVDQMEEAAAALRQAADKIVEQITEHRNENAVIRGQARADAGEWVRKVVDRLKGRHTLRPQDERGKRQQRAWTERAAMTMLDGETFAMKLDDHFTDDVNDDVAPIRRLLYDDLTQAQNRKFAIVEKAVGELDVLAKKAGYANMHDALRVLGDDVLGEASTQYVDVKVGGRSSIPLGVALKIYALDPETRFKAINGRRFKFVDDITGKSALLTPAVFAAVTRAIPLELRRFVDGAKEVRDSLRADLFAAHRMMKGWEPIAVEKYEPTRVDPWSTQDDIDLASADAVKGWLEGFDVKQWENSGFLQNRQNNASAPLLLTNWANDLVRSIDGSASVIAIAPAVRNARIVLSSQPVTSTLSDTFGTGTVQRVQELIAIASGVSMSPSHLFGRVTEAMTRNVSRSLTQFSEQSYLKQLGGLFKLAAEMPTSAAARGLRGVLSPGAREEMLRNSAYLRARASLPSQALFTQLGASGVLPTEGSAKAAGRAIAASTREAGRRLLKLQLGRAADQVGDVLSKSMPALLDTISLAQWFDQLPARMAWAGFSGPGSDPAAAASQTEKAMRRSANPSNAMDQSGFAIAMRRSGFGFMVAFTGDPFKSFAQLYRAQQVGGAYRAKVYAGVLGNVLWSAMVTVALKKGAAALGRAILGGDDEEEETITDAAERVAWLAGKDLAGIVPFGSSVASFLEIAANQSGLKPNVVDTPLAGAINRVADGLLRAYRGIKASFEDLTEAEQTKRMEDLKNGLWQSGVSLSSLLGLPLPVVDRIQRNVRAGMKEESTSDKIKRFKELQGDRSEEDQAKIARARTLAADAVMAGSVVQLRKQLRELDAAGEPMDYGELRKIVERRHPLARLAENKREAFVAGLKPGERAKMLREIKKWQTQFDDRERLFERARPAD